MKVYVVATHDFDEYYSLNVDSVWTFRDAAEDRLEELRRDDGPWDVVAVPLDQAGAYRGHHEART